MGNKSSSIFLKEKKYIHNYKVDILESDIITVPKKKNKFLVFDDGKLVLHGKNTVYKIIQYHTIKSWSFEEDKMFFLFENDSNLVLKFKNIESFKEYFKNELVLAMINGDYNFSEVNDECIKLEMDNIYLKL